MSDTEHHIGKLKPTGRSVEHYVSDCVIPDYYESKGEYFDDVFTEKAYAINGIVYEVETKDIEGEDIATSKQNPDGSIDFQVRFYNGGCSFNEAIEYALKNKEV
tara:strand:- start:389 stop:700 length:312 start_codon:yes stop_codon:yes gene_type:complete